MALFSIALDRDVKVADMGHWEDNIWSWDLVWKKNLFSWEEALLIEFEDIMRSVSLCSSHRYTIKSAYCYLFRIRLAVQQEGIGHQLFNSFWKCQVPSKVLAFSRSWMDCQLEFSCIVGVSFKTHTLIVAFSIFYNLKQ